LQQDEEEAARAYQEFVATFESSNKAGIKTFVKSSSSKGKIKMNKF
jgi:hypothetical protein